MSVVGCIATETEYVEESCYLPSLCERVISCRLAQEALTNVRKHAEATKVVVRIEIEDDELIMTGRDNGRGFDPAVLPASRRAGEELGLASMRERDHAMRGDLQTVSSLGGGTTLIFRCPVSPAE